MRVKLRVKGVETDPFIPIEIEGVRKDESL